MHLLTMLHASLPSKKINQRRELMFRLFQSGFDDALVESFDQASATNVEFFFYDPPNIGSLAQNVGAWRVSNSLPALTLREIFNHETPGDGHREFPAHRPKKFTALSSKCTRKGMHRANCQSPLHGSFTSNLLRSLLIARIVKLAVVFTTAATKHTASKQPSHP
mmetsp:Transcript_6711/g.12159  ORF Transcript_6711/g.12159 Transcript_6711/m.12159 type:complete len:164 (+) Transcript_6711:128-619(+)